MKPHARLSPTLRELMRVMTRREKAKTNAKTWVEVRGAAKASSVKSLPLRRGGSPGKKTRIKLCDCSRLGGDGDVAAADEVGPHNCWNRGKSPSLFSIRKTIA